MLTQIGKNEKYLLTAQLSAQLCALIFGIDLMPNRTSQAAAEGIAFSAYLNACGAVGVRNYLLVLNLTGLTHAAAQRAADGLHGSVFASFPYGMGLLERDLQTSTRTLCGLAMNPNVGSVLLISADRTRLEDITTALLDKGKPVTGLALDTAGHDALTLTDMAIKAGATLMQAQSKRRRTTAGLNDLCVALECGLSDPTSGIAANPLIGAVADRIIAAGGTVILGETLEWLGVEESLAARAITPEVGNDIRHAVLRREELAIAAGIDLQGVNPNRRNIEEGLSTIEEKAAGSIAKSGTAPIQGVLHYGEAPKSPGLWLMDAASYTPESLTGFAAAGAQVALFSTGSGNSYTSAIMPTIKLTANADTAARLGSQIDHNCAGLMAGEPLDDAADALIATLLDVAGGTLSFGEILGEGGETLSRYGEAL